VDSNAEIENLGYQVTNIWNITQYRTKLPLSMFYVELKPAPNNKDVFLVEYLQECKMKFELPKQLPTLWTHQELLPSKVEKHQMRR
jgi:hypothetical protein